MTKINKIIRRGVGFICCQTSLWLSSAIYANGQTITKMRADGLSVNYIQ